MSSDQHEVLIPADPNSEFTEPDKNGAVPLFVREHGHHRSPPLVVFHGFLGSSRNWGSVARKLAESYRVLLVDLRNHGRSPHTRTMTFEESVADALRVFEDYGLEQAVVMGHSLGGKVAMRFACEHPERVDRLIVLDISPRRYQPETEMVDALRELDLSILDRRTHADESLAPTVPDADKRAFLLTNLRRDEAEGFHWLPNLETLRSQREAIADSALDAGQVFNGPTLWIVGGNSDYVAKSDDAIMKRHFPALEKVVLAGVGHNVHIEGGEEFVDLVVKRSS